MAEKVVRSARVMIRAVAQGWKPLRWIKEGGMEYAALLMEVPDAGNARVRQRAWQALKAQSTIDCTCCGSATHRLTETELEEFRAVIETVVGKRPRRIPEGVNNPLYRGPHRVR